MKLTEFKGKENLPGRSTVGMLLQNLSQSDCGDNSCLFDGKGKGGMRTNGGCRCYQNYSSKIIDQYNQLEIDGDVEALGEVLFKCTDLSVYTSWDKLYKADKQVFVNEAIEIISNLSKFLVIRKG